MGESNSVFHSNSELNWGILKIENDRLEYVNCNTKCFGICNSIF